MRHNTAFRQQKKFKKNSLKIINHTPEIGKMVDRFNGVYYWLYERTDIMNIIQKLESLKRSHHYCDDSWYSCPKADEGCADEREGTDCNCGADRVNKTIDEIIEYIRPIVQQQLSAESKDSTLPKATSDNCERCRKFFE